MTWTSPMTAVDNSGFTASLYNANIRDNLLLTAPAKATTASRVFNVTAANQIHQTEIAAHEVTTSQSTTSGTYTNLTTTGPTVTVNIVGQQAMVWFTCQLDQDTTDMQAAAAIEVSGASSYVADNARCCVTRDGMPSGNPIQLMASYLFDPLSEGSTTFTAKYRTGGLGTATFSNRRLIVWPL